MKRRKLNSQMLRRTVHFSSEDELVEFMRASRETEAPIVFKYADGSAVDSETMERIHKRFFERARP